MGMSTEATLSISSLTILHNKVTVNSPVPRKTTLFPPGVYEVPRIFSKGRGNWLVFSSPVLLNEAGQKNYVLANHTDT